LIQEENRGYSIYFEEVFFLQISVLGGERRRNIGGE